jgi:hypothetical protein
MQVIDHLHRRERQAAHEASLIDQFERRTRQCLRLEPRRGAFIGPALSSPRQEQNQMMTMAKGRPMPTAPPITIAIAKSKPAIACQDIYTTPLEGKLSPPKDDRSIAIEAGQVRIREPA